MNSLIVIKLLLCSISVCCSLEAENKTEECEDNDVIMRQRRGQLHNQNKLNNDSAKLRFDLNNIGRRLPHQSHQRPIPLHNLNKPLTKLRPRLSPLHNRINVINKGLLHPVPCPCQPQHKICAPPKLKEEAKSVVHTPQEELHTPAENKTTTVDVEDTKEHKKAVFFTEHDSVDDFFEESDQDSAKSPTVNQVKEKFPIKANEACVDNKLDKDVILGIINELPSLIKSTINERLKSEGNSIIIKNITEITLPIKRSNDIDSDSIVCDDPKMYAKVSAKTKKLGKINNRYNQELVDLLLKPILKANKNGEVILVDHSNGRFESINIQQHDYSEVVQQKRDPTVYTMEEKEQTPEPESQVPVSCAPGDPDTSPNLYYAGSYSIPGVTPSAPTTYPCVYGSNRPYTTPASMYPTPYNPYGMYMKSPYDCMNNFMPAPQNFIPFQHNFMSPTQNGKPLSQNVMPLQHNCMIPTQNIMPLPQNVMAFPHNALPLSQNAMPVPQNVMPLSQNGMPLSQNGMPLSQNVMSRPQNVLSDYSALYTPNYNFADNLLNNMGANGFDDKKNTTWKSWTNTEIVIRKNKDSNGDCNNRTLTIMPIQAYRSNYNAYTNYHPNRYVPSLYGTQPYYCHPRSHVTH